MYTALYATSEALRAYLQAQLGATLPTLGFQGGGTRIVSLNSPQEMREEMRAEGLSLWLYRVLRDDMRLNDPPERLAPTLFRAPPLPLRLHYLITPVTLTSSLTPGGSPNTELLILGRAMQALHTHPLLRGTDLHNTEFEGTETELHLRLEALHLDEIARVWEALNAPYQLSVSYEVSVVDIDVGLEPDNAQPVDVALPDYAVVVGGQDA